MYHLIRLKKSVCAATVVCLFLILGSTFVICAVDRPADATTSQGSTKEEGIDLPIIMYHSLL